MLNEVRLKLGSVFKRQGRKKKETLRCHPHSWSDKIPLMWWIKKKFRSDRYWHFFMGNLNSFHPHHFYVLYSHWPSFIHFFRNQHFQARFRTVWSFVKFADKSGTWSVFSKYIHKLFVQPSYKTTKYALKLHAPKTHFPPSFFIKWTHHLHFWCSALRDIIFRTWSR